MDEDFETALTCKKSISDAKVREDELRTQVSDLVNASEMKTEL